MAINCSSIPDNLFESELFGYEEGSFTGAKKGGKIGKIEMAQGGTLFLDEIGEMPLFAQPKLLRILQNMSWNGWAPIKRPIWISGSLPPPTGTWVKWWQKRPSAETCITGST